MFPSQKYRCGQSSLEYLALAVFVMMGILIGGPYVVRGINSHFKALEEGALDSEREKISQGAFVSGSKGLPECRCTDLFDSGCGNGMIRDDAGVPCNRKQKVFMRKCNILGCEDTVKTSTYHIVECRDDSLNVCCDPVIVSKCGNTDGPTGKCFSPTGNQRYESKMCGSPTATLVETCSFDASCFYQCQPLGEHASWCNEAVQNVNLSNPDVPVTYREAGGCLGSVKCEAQCIAPYVTDTRYTNGCCGGGAGGIIINGGPFGTVSYGAQMQADSSFGEDTPDCIATPRDSRPPEEQVFQTFNYIFTNAGLPSPGLTAQNQTDVYAVGQADYYWNPVVPGDDIYFAIISCLGGYTCSFGVYNQGNPAGGTLLTSFSLSGYTGNGTALSPYRGGKFTASGPIGFFWDVTTPSPHYVFHSDPTLDAVTGGIDPMLSFQLSGLAGKTIWINTATGVVPMPLTADTYLLAFDYALPTTNRDYNEEIVLVTKVKPVP